MNSSNSQSGAGLVQWFIGLLVFGLIAGGSTYFYINNKPAKEVASTSTSDQPRLDPVLESSATLTSELLELTDALTQIDSDINSTDDLAPTL